MRTRPIDSSGWEILSNFLYKYVSYFKTWTQRILPMEAFFAGEQMKASVYIYKLNTANMEQNSMLE